jgi:large subunit ribosomal protein L27
MIFNLQLFAHKKGLGSSRNGRDSESKRLGTKRADGQWFWRNILVRQGARRSIRPERGIGSDDTLYAKVDGVLRFEHKGKFSKQASVYPLSMRSKKGVNPAGGSIGLLLLIRKSDEDTGGRRPGSRLFSGQAFGWRKTEYGYLGSVQDNAALIRRAPDGYELVWKVRRRGVLAALF